MVLEDRQLQPHQLRPGVETQLVGEVGPGAGDGAQRVGLSPASVEGLGQQRREPFAQGLLGHRGLEARHGFAVAAVVEQALEAIFDSGEPQLLQPHALGLGVGLVGHVEQRRSVPQAERLVEQGQGLGRWRLLGLPHELLEAVDVERARLQRQAVAARVAHEDRLLLVAEGAAEQRDIGLQGVGGARRRLATPEVVDQARGGDRAASCQQEAQQQRPLPSPADGDRSAVLFDRQRAQDAEPQRRSHGRCGR